MINIELIIGIIIIIIGLIIMIINSYQVSFKYFKFKKIGYIFGTIIICIGIIFIILYFLSSNNKNKNKNKNNNNIEYINFIRNNIKTVGGIKVPKSYNVMPEYFTNLPDFSPEQFELVYNNNQRYDKYVEIFNQTNGINIYDASLWVTVLAIKGNNNDLQDVINWLVFLGKGMGLGNNLMGTKVTGDNWSYGNNKRLTDWPDNEYGNIGYSIRMTNTGKWQTNVDSLPCVLLNKTLGGASYGDYAITPVGKCNIISDPSIPLTPVNSLSFMWSDYRPVSGENAWSGLIGAMHVYKICSDNDKSKIVPYINRIVQTLDALQFNKGGIYYSPQNWQDINKTKLTPIDILKWDSTQFSVENMASIAGGLNMVVEIYPEGIIKTLANNILQKLIVFIIDNCINYDKSYSFKDVTSIQGGTISILPPSVIPSGTCPLGGLPIINGMDFAVDTYTWLVCVYGNLLEKKKPGVCYNLWNTVKYNGGYTNKNNKFSGLGYSINKNVNILSGEWTLGGIIMCRIMLDIYKNDSNKISSLNNDIKSMRIGLQEITTSTNITVSGKAVLYANKRYTIPFGWNAHPNASLASTAWMVFDNEGINPFRIDCQMKAAIDI
jgi:hypothetical protein